MSEVKRGGNPREEPSEVIGRRFVVPISGDAEQLWQKRFREAVTNQLASRSHSSAADNFVQRLKVGPGQIEFVIGDGDIKLLAWFLDVIDASIGIANQLVVSDQERLAQVEARGRAQTEERDREIADTLRTWAADHPIETDL